MNQLALQIFVIVTWWELKIGSRYEAINGRTWRKVEEKGREEDRQGDYRGVGVGRREVPDRN